MSLEYQVDIFLMQKVSLTFDKHSKGLVSTMAFTALSRQVEIKVSGNKTRQLRSIPALYGTFKASIA